MKKRWNADEIRYERDRENMRGDIEFYEALVVDYDIERHTAHLAAKDTEIERLKRRLERKTLKRHQPCGCQVCICENIDQCQGCGAHLCNTDNCVFKVGGPSPEYEPDPMLEENERLQSQLAAKDEEIERLREALNAAADEHSRSWYLSDDPDYSTNTREAIERWLAEGKARQAREEGA